MTGTTVGHQIAEQVADELEAESFVSSTTVEQNHKGPFVRAFVPDRLSKNELFDNIEQYPCYIDVVME